MSREPAAVCYERSRLRPSYVRADRDVLWSREELGEDLVGGNQSRRARLGEKCS
jgi:hypothetical protein